MRSLRDQVAEAIRGDGSDMCDQPWSQLSFDRKAGWLGDADRAISVIEKVLSKKMSNEVVSDDPDIMAALSEAFK